MLHPLHRSRAARFAPLFGALCLVLGACGGSGATPVDSSFPSDGAMTSSDAGLDGGEARMDSATPGSDLTSTVYLDQFLERSCAWFLRCEPKIGAVAFGEVLCHPTRQAELRASFLRLLESGEAVFDADVASRCLDALDAAECNVADLDLDLCDAAFVGQRAPGESCSTGLACAEGECVTGASCPGTCVAVPEGGACGRARECAGGLACVGGVCAAAREAGESCERASDCAQGLVCGGVCGAPPELGEACARGVGGDVCAADLVCVDGRCAVAAAAGESCDSTHACVPGTRCVDGSCAATSLPGEPCVVGGCLALNVCVDGVCQTMGAAGDACSEALPCVQGACRGGVCTLLADGESCVADVQFGECQGLCVGGSCAPKSAEGESCRGSSQCEAGLECREVGASRSCRPLCSEGVSP